jgi:putative ABC transport system ATP-binding protein
MGTTVVIITHNASIADIADRVLTMADGRLASERHNPQPVPPSAVSW